MRHKVFGKKLGRDIKERKALFRNLSRALIRHGQIETTLAKAKAVRGEIEGLVTKAKNGSKNSLAAIESFLNHKDIIDILVQDIAPRFQQKSSGFTRITRTGVRSGDNAQQVLLEWSIDEDSKKSLPTSPPKPSSAFVATSAKEARRREQPSPRRLAPRRRGRRPRDEVSVLRGK